MKKLFSIFIKYTIFIFLLIPEYAFTQNSILIFNEDFESGNNPFIEDSSFGLPSGINKWIINNEYNGNGIYPNTTSQTNTISGTIGNPNGNYLHIADTTQITNVANANYDPQSSSDHFYVLEESFCTLGYDSIEFSFFYLCEGSNTDYAEVFYSIDGGSWISCGSQYKNQTLWKNERIMNPAFNNVYELRFGFRWVNANSNSSTSIAFGVDDIFLIGNSNQTTNPIDVNVTYLSNTTICPGNNLTFRYEISDTLCGGQYLISLSDVNGNFTNPTAMWTHNLFYPNTSAYVFIQIPIFTTPGTCYKIRVNRVSPSPQITGFESACFEVALCPNNIITAPLGPPVVTRDTADVCVGSVIDIPFYATGVYNTGNVFTAYLSDSTGSFANPTLIGQLPSNLTFDPTVAPYLPGNISGFIPDVPDGCNYYIKIRSSNPIATDTSSWGPLCIKHCDIETNNRQDLQFCVTASDGDSALIPIDINVPPCSVIYNPGLIGFANQFQVELLDAMNFTRVNIGGLGSMLATTDTNMWVVIPNFQDLIALGIPAGNYYMRIIATSSNTPGNHLGTLIRLTIGHPSDNPLTVFATDSLICSGDIVQFYVSPTQQGSSYLWRENGVIWPPISSGNNPAPSISLIYPGNAGTYNYTVQETNYGCVGAVSPAKSIKLINIPNINIVPNAPVCFGDTIGYFVQFTPNTYYSWNDPNCGSMLDTTNNQMTIAWNQTNGQCNLQISATNKCGSNSGNTTIYINPLPFAFAGNDTIICEGDSVQLNSSGGISYNWSPVNSLLNWNTSTPIAFPLNTESYIVKVTDNQNCSNFDTMIVNVNPVPLFDAGNEIIIICGDSIQLNATDITGASYNWLPNNNINNINIHNPIVYPIETNYYLVESKTLEGCEVKDSVLIKVNEMFVDAGLDTSICKGSEITIGGIPSGITSSIFSWSPSNSLDDASKANPIAKPIINTAYILNISNVLGCNNSDTINIETIIYPATDTLFEICKDFNLKLQPSYKNSTYLWNTGANSQDIVVNNAGLYTVVMLTSDSCLITDSFQVTIRDCEFYFYTPNSFTPNNDGNNDIFAPITNGIDSLHFMIFNRWGEKIFESNDFTPWDGKFNGEDVVSGIYSWSAYYVGNGEFGIEEKSKVGLINLIR